jgi:hypothetical protein
MMLYGWVVWAALADVHGHHGRGPALTPAHVGYVGPLPAAALWVDARHALTHPPMPVRANKAAHWHCVCIE